MYRQGTPPTSRDTYGRGVDNRTEIREFLVSDSAKISLEHAGPAAD
ncbi:hypothetical protein ACVCAH_15790 [Micromonospora sp. LZ34]